MTTPVRCPECETNFNFPTEHLGKKIRCKNCHAVFVTEEFTEKPKPKAKPPKLPASVSSPKRDVDRQSEEVEENAPRKRKSKTAPKEVEEQIEGKRPRKNTKKKKSNTGLLIGIGLAAGVIFLAGLGGALYLMFGGKTNEPLPIAVVPIKDTGPVIPPGELKRYTIWKARIANTEVQNRPDPKEKGGKSAYFNYQNNDNQELNGFVLVIVRESGEKYLLSNSRSYSWGASFSTIGKESGIMSLEIPPNLPLGKSKKGPRDGGSGGGGILEALPSLGKNLKAYLAITVRDKANTISEGERVSNITELVVE